MSNNGYVLEAESRAKVGKGSARELRRNGKIPAVIYGEKQSPIAIAVPYKEIYYKIYGGGFKTTALTINVDGQKIRVLPKDYHMDPVRDVPLHVDFLRLGAHSVVTVNVPVRFLNEEAAPGLKRGGVLNIVRHEVELEVSADNIPDAIEIDLTGREIGDAIHISTVTLPEGAQPVIADRDFTIATIAAPAVSLAADEGEAPASAE